MYIYIYSIYIYRWYLKLAPLFSPKGHYSSMILECQASKMWNIRRYCGGKKSCTTWDGRKPLINGKLMG